LYIDDGTLCITKEESTIERKDDSICTFHYARTAKLQTPQLEILRQHIKDTFHLSFRYLAVNDGHKSALKFTSAKDTFTNLDYIAPITNNCPSMYDKANWTWRLQKRKACLKKPTLAMRL
jgi:hypothetical protein